MPTIYRQKRGKYKLKKGLLNGCDSQATILNKRPSRCDTCGKAYEGNGQFCKNIGSGDCQEPLAETYDSFSTGERFSKEGIIKKKKG